MELLTSSRYRVLEDKCSLCHERDMYKYQKRQKERKRAAKEISDETGTVVEKSKETELEVKVEQDLDMFEERRKLEDADRQAQLDKNRKPLSSSTKIKEEDADEENIDIPRAKKQRRVDTYAAEPIPISSFEPVKPAPKDSTKSGDSTSAKQSK